MEVFHKHIQKEYLADFPPSPLCISYVHILLVYLHVRKSDHLRLCSDISK